MGTQATRIGRISLANQLYHVTAVTTDRQPHFTSFKAASACAKTFSNSAKAERAQLLAWVLMPDHVHWLIQLGDNANLAACVNWLKGSSTRSVQTLLGIERVIWQRGYYDHALRKDESVEAVARYIVANPIRAGLVASVRNYAFWDAVWL